MSLLSEQDTNERLLFIRYVYIISVNFDDRFYDKCVYHCMQCATEAYFMQAAWFVAPRCWRSKISVLSCRNRSHYGAAMKFILGYYCTPLPVTDCVSHGYIGIQRFSLMILGQYT